MSVNQLMSGMCLGKPVYGTDGRVLLREYVILTNGYIAQLKKLGISYVYIQDIETVDVLVQDTVSIETTQEVVGRIKGIYDRISNPDEMNRFVHSGKLGQEFSDLFMRLLDELMSNSTFIVNLSNIYTSDAFLYAHCLNVGIYASVLAMAHGYCKDRLKDFGIGAMLHDIGKLWVDKAILDKPGKLTELEREEIEKHTWFGYEILKKQIDLPTVSAHCALQHHEKYDGSGYPRKLKGNEIHEFGRMLAVPDVFDALTSNRVYRKAFLPHEALEYLYANVNTHFDETFVQLFHQHINIYPCGLPVELSNGASGVISRTNPQNLQRPFVLILMDNGCKVKPYEIDLFKELNVTITRCDLESVQYGGVH